MSFTADEFEAALDSFEAAVGVQTASKLAAAAASRVFSQIEKRPGSDTAFDMGELGKMMEHCEGAVRDCDKAKNYIKRVLASLTEIEMKIKRRRMEQDMEHDKIEQHMKKQPQPPRPTSRFAAAN